MSSVVERLFVEPAAGGDDDQLALLKQLVWLCRFSFVNTSLQVCSSSHRGKSRHNKRVWSARACADWLRPGQA